MSALRGKVALITGGGRGIGMAVAVAFAREGASVVVASRTQGELDDVVSQVREAGGRALAVRTDVADPEAVARLVQATIGAYGQIDVLVNAAGVYGPIGRMWELDAERWEAAIRTNLYGTFLCCRAVLPHMIARRVGQIVNLAGGGSTSPLPRFTAYSASKTAIVRLTETLAEEVKEFNIQVNAIAPGRVDTRLQDQLLAAGEAAGEYLEPLRKLRATGEGGSPPELAAQLCLFIASDQAEGLNGKLISAPHDGWQSWDAARIAELASAPWLTLRRMDPYTLGPLVEELSKSSTV